MPLEIDEVLSGAPVLDWTVLRVWNRVARCRMANMLSTTAPRLQRCACEALAAAGVEKMVLSVQQERDQQAFYDKGYLNCRCAWD
jgi:hypothetical protein